MQTLGDSFRLEFNLSESEKRFVYRLMKNGYKSIRLNLTHYASMRTNFSIEMKQINLD